jgi:hypothetical protein
MRQSSSAAAVTALAGVSACSGSGDKKDDSPDASSTPASRICDGALDQSAVAALKRLGGTDSFQELASGGARGFTVDRAATHLHDAVGKRSKCSVYLPDGKSDAPLIELDFQASDDYPSKSAVKKQEFGKNLVFYPIGVYAGTSDENSTTLYFACSTKGKDGTKKYVDAGAFTSADQLKGHSTSKDRMTILNSVARHLADKLGCADEAKLPTSVPEGEAAGS